MMRLRLVFAAAGLLLLGGLFLWLMVPRHRITADSIRRIELGMTHQQVEIILGGQAGNYSHPKTHAIYSFGCTGPPIDELRNCNSARHVEEWIGQNAAVKICFDADDRVLDFVQGIVIPVQPSLLDEIRWWLGR